MSLTLLKNSALILCSLSTLIFYLFLFNFGTEFQTQPITNHARTLIQIRFLFSLEKVSMLGSLMWKQVLDLNIVRLNDNLNN